MNLALRAQARKDTVLRGALNQVLSDFLRNFPTPIYLEDEDGYVVFANHAYLTLLNAPINDVVGHQAGIKSSLFQAIKSEVNELAEPNLGCETEILCKLVAADADDCMVLGKAQRVVDDNGQPLILWSLSDIRLFVSYEQELEDKHRELRKQQSKLRELAAIDPLTGALNRRSFYDQAEEVVTYAKIGGLDIGVLMLDLDKFKVLNDTHGHAAGDEVLIAFTQLLKDCIRGSDVLARLGGEEFVLLLPDANHVATQRIAQRIIDRTQNTPVIFEGETLHFTTSIGGTMWAADEPNIDVSLSRADKFLYKAKDSGRNQLQFGSDAVVEDKVA